MFRLLRLLKWALIGGAIIAAALYITSEGRSKTVLDPVGVEAIEQIVKDYLLANPELIEKALAGLEVRRVAEKKQRQHDSIVASYDELYDDPGSHITGNLDGDVTVVEFFDYRCSYCKRVFSTVRALMNSDANLRLVYKEFPILGPQSTYASRFALSARKIDPDKYVALHNGMMKVAGGLDRAAVFAVAAELGFEPETVEAGMGAADISATLDANYRLAERLGVGGTPAFIIGDQMVPGAVSLERFAAIIEETRTGCATC